MGKWEDNACCKGLEKGNCYDLTFVLVNDIEIGSRINHGGWY